MRAYSYLQDEEGNYKLPQNEVKTIKQELIGLMTSVPPNMQAQLGEAISAIAESDFWERWDTLVDVCCLILKLEARADTVEGSYIATNPRQRYCQQRCFAGCTLHLQTLETAF